MVCRSSASTWCCCAAWAAVSALSSCSICDSARTYARTTPQRTRVSPLARSGVCWVRVGC
jgi:hypothetical protein